MRQTSMHRPSTPIKQAIEYGSQDASIYANQGHIFYAANEHAQALDAYKQAIEYGSQDASVYISKGRILSHLKQYKEALEDLKIAISIDARNASSYCIMGDIYFNLKKYKKSFGAYRKFIRVDYRGNGSLLNEFKFYKEILAAYWYIIQNDVSDNYIFYKIFILFAKLFAI